MVLQIIDGVNAEGTVKAMYSTPSIYLKAKNAENLAWTVKTDDFVSGQSHTLCFSHTYPAMIACSNPADACPLV